MAEEWRLIPGFPGYAVSSLGRIHSNIRGGVRLLSLIKEPRGYLRVGIKRQDGKRIITRVHRIVALAFGIIEPTDHVNHLNGVKADNRLENLEKSNHADNIRHAYRTGITKVRLGARANNAKLTREQAMEVLKDYMTNATLRTIGAKYGVASAHIRSIASGKTWPELKEERVRLGVKRRCRSVKIAEEK